MSKSFTLIELLVVLGLIAILAAIIITVINPTKIFQNARDSQRIGDLNNLQKAFEAIVVDTGGLFNELSFASANTVYLSLPDSSSNCDSYLSQLPSLPSGWSYKCSATPTNIDGTGWIPLNFKQFPLIQLSKLPIDPLNQPPYYYSYVAGGSYEITAALESEANKGINSKAGQDGGTSWNVYEVGSNKKLTPLGIEDGGGRDKSLVGYWPFDEGTGTIAKDLSGNNNNGTLYNGPQWVDGKVGKALSFDGVNDYVWGSSPSGLNFNSTNEITAMAWIKLTPDNYDFWLSMNLSGNIKYRFGSNSSGMPYWDMGQHIDRAYNRFNFTSGQWYYVVFRGKKEEINIVTRLYINGDFKFFQDEGIISLTPVDVIYLGTGEGPSTHPFNGLIDEVRIYNRALSDDEIKALYEATK